MDNKNNTKSITVNGNRIGFFFGAGASVEFGIPSMKKITESFYDKINRNGKEKEKKLFNHIYESLEKVYGKYNVDLESIMSIIIGLKENSFIDSIGDIGLFLLKNKGIKNIHNNSKYDITLLDSIENKFKKFIRSKITLNSKNIDRLREVYFDFFKQLCQLVNCNDNYAKSYDKWVFFTTNYDNILEEYWVNYRKYLYLDLGFDTDIGNTRKIMFPDRLIEINKNNSETSMQLIKLHGSLNWIRNSQNQIEEHEYNLNIDNVKNRSGSKDFEDDIIIYPLSQKQLYFSPYIQLFRVLLEELNKRDLWLVIGYSFRDPVIRTMFEKSLQENNDRKILLVLPNAHEIKKLFSQNIQNQIFEVKDYFGMRNYQVVNANIIQQLLKIS